jgi:hypothetical protein
LKQRLSIQSYFRPELTMVVANKDYRDFRDLLAMIDQNISRAELESMAVDFAKENSRGKWTQSKVRFAIFSLRAELLRSLLGVPSFREFSRQLASSDLLADFCQIRELDGIRCSSKSTLERASKLFKPEQIRRFHELIVEVSANADWCERVGLQRAVDASVCLIDSTCVEANVHFPVDWVLLKDVSVTLLKAVKLIRKHGVHNRMVHEPAVLMRAMNRLCIEMTHCRRKIDSKKQRKRVFRQVKTLLRRVAAHAQCHRQKLLEHRELTGLSDAQIARMVERIDEKLELVPKVIKQAHERIIGGRKVENADKLLSVHEPDIHVMVRGKASGEVEFGNGLCVAENPDGLILDYEFYQQQAPSDSQQLIESVDRQDRLQIDQHLQAFVGDRGFDSVKCAKKLGKHGIENHLCPRNPSKLKERMQEPQFCQLQRRRGGTEARIAILKNHGKSRVCRAKGFTNRSRWIGWAVVAHNMWWIARKVLDQNKQTQLQAA